MKNTNEATPEYCRKITYNSEVFGGYTCTFENLMKQALRWAENNPEHAKEMPVGHIYTDEGYYMEIFYEVRGDK